MALIQAKVDDELYEALKIRAHKEGRTLSSVMRDILRRGLGVASDARTRGYLEGRQEGYAAVLRAVQEAIRAVPTR